MIASFPCRIPLALAISPIGEALSGRGCHFNYLRLACTEGPCFLA